MRSGSMLDMRWNGVLSRIERLGAEIAIPNTLFGTGDLWKEMLKGIDENMAIYTKISNIDRKDYLVIISWAIFQTQTLVLNGLVQINNSTALRNAIWMAFDSIKQMIKNMFHDAMENSANQHYVILNIILDVIKPIVEKTIESVTDMKDLNSIASRQTTNSSQIFARLTGKNPVIGVVPSIDEIGVQSWEELMSTPYQNSRMQQPSMQQYNQHPPQQPYNNNGSQQLPMQQYNQQPPQQPNGSQQLPTTQQSYNGVPSPYQQQVQTFNYSQPHTQNPTPAGMYDQNPPQYAGHDVSHTNRVTNSISTSDRPAPIKSIANREPQATSKLTPSIANATTILIEKKRPAAAINQSAPPPPSPASTSNRPTPSLVDLANKVAGEQRKAAAINQSVPPPPPKVETRDPAVVRITTDAIAPTKMADIVKRAQASAVSIPQVTPAAKSVISTSTPAAVPRPPAPVAAVPRPPTTAAVSKPAPVTAIKPPVAARPKKRHG
jgi:hypothetical protein